MYDLYLDSDIVEAFTKLKEYCEAENFKGWDPYDGLSSKIFRATPLNDWSISRLVWIQVFKRNPINLRKIFHVPKELNPKALGLFLTAYSNLYKIAEGGDTTFGTKEEISHRIDSLADRLFGLKSEEYSGTCWGYNFDWQARGGLYFEAYTPTVVATTFAAYGLLDAYEATGVERLREEALGTARFVLDDLNRTQKDEGFLFSYAPEFGNNTVYNASLLGSKLLSRLYALNPEEEYLSAAQASVLACCNAQNDDGSWHYGELPFQDWVDSFHTGFNLEAIYDYEKYTGDETFRKHFNEGYRYYVKHFFLDDGTPKYYDDTVYPVDSHCPAQLLITLDRCGKMNNDFKLASKVVTWTIENMQHKKGYFYYQINKLYTNRIPYMRWSQAWMLAALSCYLKHIYTNA